MNIPTIKRPWERNIKQGVRHNPDQFYSSTAWRKARASFLTAHPHCAHCLEKGKRTNATMVDHIHRIKAGGDRLNPQNFQALCDICHAIKSANESNERHKNG